MSAGYIVGHVMPVEEEWMKKTFGREWTDYCAKVKRFIVI
jgi:protein-S-isoprenylcysteine O-methyltransferase Ste14